MKTKICSTCKVEKGLAEYSKDSRRNDGLMYYCKECYALMRMDGDKDKMRVEKAKANSSEWNKFRESLSNTEFTRKELSELAKMENLKYVDLVIPLLVKRQIISVVRVGDNGVDVYSFKGHPIHYTVFVEVFKYHECLRDKRQKNKSKMSKKPVSLTGMGVSLQNVGIEYEIKKYWGRHPEDWSKGDPFFEYAMIKAPLDIILDPTIIICVNSEDEKSYAEDRIKRILDDIKIKNPNTLDEFKVKYYINSEVHDSDSRCLVNELRKRGFEVSAKKTIEL